MIQIQVILMILIKILIHNLKILYNNNINENIINSLLANILSGPGSIQPIGNSMDQHNCLVSAGHSYCESTRNCIRQWETRVQTIIMIVTIV